jgi:hypothetical protein
MIDKYCMHYAPDFFIVGLSSVEREGLLRMIEQMLNYPVIQFQEKPT